MVESYKKVKEMEAIASLKFKQDRKALEKIDAIIYQNKYFIIDRLVAYLKKELDIDYFSYKVMDIDGNVADILVKKDSKIFAENILDKDYIDFYIENLIDSHMFNNKDEIILIDFSFDDNLLNLGYLCDSLNYQFLSYSKEIVDKLIIFCNYVINKGFIKSKINLN